MFHPAKPGTNAPPLSWWHWTVGANWQHPFGVGSTIAGQENYPVVHIAYADAVAYAQWAGKSLPCAVNYCSRFRPAARESEAPDTGTTHIGFRLVKNLM